MPLKLGLTGGIGAGKSLVSAYFEQLGATIVDADVIAREVVAPHSQLLQKITQHFGTDILQANQHLDRSKLRSIIFNNEDEKVWLEACLHPVIREQIIQQLEQSTTDITILASPLLIEKNQRALVDALVLVDIPEILQIERACHRDTNSVDQIKRIITSQVSRDEKRALANYVIDNSGEKEDTYAQCRALWYTFNEQI